jgi:uncharacterized protein (DUF1778 family)
MQPSDRLLLKSAADIRHKTVSEYVRDLVLPVATATVESTASQPPNDAD